jgi:hypothetical protein
VTTSGYSSIGSIQSNLRAQAGIVFKF